LNRQSQRPHFPILGAEPHQWGKGQKGKARERDYKRLVRESYDAAMLALRLEPGRHSRGRYQLGIATKAQLVALKRLAYLLFNEAHDADGVLNRRTQETDENLAASEK
jgi:hypothetical protein